MKRLLIIPAAGLATRMMPMSASMSKAMIPVAGKPILAHILESIKDNVDHIVVVHGMHSDISDFLKKKDYHNVSWCEQNKNNPGPLGAIHSGLKYFKDFNWYNNENYYTTIWLGDTLIKNKDRVNDILINHNDIDTTQLCTAKVDDWSRWCLIKEDASELFDKPIEQPDTDNALVGIYKFNYDFEDLYAVSEFLINNEYEEILPLIESYADFQRDLIDVTDCWVDCGDLPSLYKANSILISNNARGYNNIEIKNGIVYKKSSRFEQELNWYTHINKYESGLLHLTPQFYGEIENKVYGLELCSGNTLQELVLYHNITRRDVWETIIHTVLDRVRKMHVKTKKICFIADTNNNTEMFNSNIINRYNQLYSDCIIEDYELLILSDYVQDSFQLFTKTFLTTSKIIHGDMHFGNIIFDAATNKVKLIDPRGGWGNNNISVDGHVLYDLAKLYQSVLCQYCHISADEYPSEKESVVYEMLVDIIDKNLSNHYAQEDILLAKRYSISLLASAIPCHSDNPQRQHIMKNMALDLITSGKY